jgi:hypothetical protein
MLFPVHHAMQGSAAELDVRIILVGFDPLRQRLRGECPARF